jgi:crotonobetainyl-CoA:carnitine CoA-transferase CaiB-like acyl-CoA transferase
MDKELPLAGIRVIELCWVWSGPFLGQLLADLGAEVVKVEWYKRYDLYRTRGVERLAGKFHETIRREMSQSFHGLNRNKIGTTLDLKVESHKLAFLELAQKSDLVIENFTSGTLDRLGVGYSKMHKLNPAIVLLSLAGFGSTSKLAKMRAYGLVLSSLSGMEAQIVDSNEGEFLGSPTFVSSDPNAATYGLLAAIAAIMQARRTGKGTYIELSQLEAAAHVAADDDCSLIETALRLGLSPSLPHNDVSIIMTKDNRYICAMWPDKMETYMSKELATTASEMAVENAISFLAAKGVKSTKILEKPSEFGTGSAAKGTLIPTLHPITGPEQIVAAPWWIDGHRAPLRKTAPTLGEGNSYVLGKLLGWDIKDYESLSPTIVEQKNG